MPVGAMIALSRVAHRRGRELLAAIAALAMLLVVAGAAMAQTAQPRTVSFPSADGKTTLVGYLFAPAGRPQVAPAVVLMPGRSGAYSALAKGNYSSVTLEKGLRDWAELWAAQGYWALVVDGLGPRGFPGGLADGAHPAAVSELSVGPLDAYGALRYLHASPRVRSDRVALLGWSSGGSAALAAMRNDTLPTAEISTGRGFRAALALSPACGLPDHGKAAYVPYAPVRIFVGGRDDEETAVSACQKLATAAKAAGGDVTLTVYQGATRDFDDPARNRQAAPANATATEETRRQAIALLSSVLGH